MANLYYLGGTDPDDLTMDYSLLVSASSPERAAELWRDYYFPDDPDECPFGMKVHKELPIGLERMTIWRVLHDPFHEAALSFEEPGQLPFVGCLVEIRS